MTRQQSLPSFGNHQPENSNSIPAEHADANVETKRKLDESIEKHMYMIGSILAQIIREWSAEQKQEIQHCSEQSI